MSGNLSTYFIVTVSDEGVFDVDCTTEIPGKDRRHTCSIFDVVDIMAALIREAERKILMADIVRALDGLRPSDPLTPADILAQAMAARMKEQ